MTKPDGIAPEAKTDDVSWGTWEELLLAFAVNRHGTGAWDSIAAELQKRASGPCMSVTGQACRLKYIDLRRRFVSPNDDDNDDKSSATAPLLEELRKLRVAELRREVQRYDLNIESLEMKVKRMEEERERTDSKTSPDPPEKSGEEQDTTAARDVKPDQLSANESNSTDLEAEKLKPAAVGSEPAGEETREATTGQSSAEPDGLKSEPDRKAVREDSCNGSSNSIEKEELDRKGKGEPASESVESDGEEEGNKESSDVQSSASRSRKDEGEMVIAGGGDKVRRGCTSGDDEDQSGAVKELELDAESRSLVEFLGTVRGHRLGSVFARRLRSQESSEYQKMIRQHVDLETIETRLKEGWYSGSVIKFFRDLLLLVNNALVYFLKNSPEANAATELHKVISIELSQRFPKPEPSSGKEASLQSVSKQKKEEPEPLLLKPRISGSLIVCRKRSSIAAKADKKKEQAEDKDTKPVEEPKFTKKRTSDRFPPVTSSSKKNGKKNSVVEPKSESKGEPKSESKKNQSTSLDSKKRGAANFLNRMKQGSSSNNGVLLDALKNTPLTSDSSSGKGGGSSEVKKNDSGKKKEVVSNMTRRSTETRQAKEKGSPGKRNVGRPPKRGAAPPPPPPLGKRGRGDTETPPSKQQPKKRSRKL